MAAAWSAGLDINTLPLFMADGLDGVGEAAARFLSSGLRCRLLLQ
jgi:hypothetical protein